jgi:SAM-dependent methyltransferase/uncharacterized protein YbaR (Trm112 family)
MYPALLEYLGCPLHLDARFELEPGSHLSGDGEIVSGTLRCPVCNAEYPIADGIVDLIGSQSLPMSLTQAINMLPLTSWGYERTWRSRALTILSGEAFGYDRELALIGGLAAPDRGGLIIDVACSNGLYARALERARGSVPGHVVGIDHALPMLRQARAYARRDNLRISFVRARAQALPFAAEAASVLVMGGSLNEIGDVDAALHELHRVMAPTGRTVLMCLVRADSGSGKLAQQVAGTGGIAFWSIAELNRHLARAALRLRAQWRYRVVVFSVLTRSH